MPRAAAESISSAIVAASPPYAACYYATCRAVGRPSSRSSWQRSRRCRLAGRVAEERQAEERQWQQRATGAAAAPKSRPFEPWEPPPGSRVVLFSQVKDCASIIESFVCHYAALGFYKLLLYLDDPEDVAREVLEESGWIDAKFVELTDVDDKLRATWPSLPSWERVGSYSGMEVQSRQILNNEHALWRAKELDADWLLHVDSDELLCLPEPAPAFFGGLSARGCSMYTFNNVEGVPQAPDSTDVLRSVRVFRQNMGFVPRNPQAGAAFFSWQVRLGGWFISYENGKTAVNVRRAVKCLSVCMWEIQPQLEPGKAKEPDGSTCTWYTNNDWLWDAAVKRRREGRLHHEEEVPRRDLCRGAVLLHFCVCDFASFWRKRWSQLGYLSASDQFRVRASSGAMMARFYRLQREGRQGEARELYETMCVCEDEGLLARHLEVGILLRANPGKPGGAEGPSWPQSRRRVRYAKLAERLEARGVLLYEAWQLYGKAIEAAIARGGDPSSGNMPPEDVRTIASAYTRRAACAMKAGIPGSAIGDSASALRLGDTAASLQHGRALEALGRSVQALAAAEQGLRAARGAAEDPVAAPAHGGDAAAAAAAVELRMLVDRLRQAVKESGGAAEGPREVKLLTPAEVQFSVAKAVRPDTKESRLYRAMIPVAMSWWQEVGGDELKFANALGRTAIATRVELAAIDASVRPQPFQFMRQLWDASEAELEESGAIRLDLRDARAGLWPAVASSCRALLGERGSARVAGCDSRAHELHALWLLCSAVSAEIRRAFAMRELLVLTEVRVSRPHPGQAPAPPAVDNGGLLPDNRREASFRIFAPAEGDGGKGTLSPATLTLSTKDGEKTLSFNVGPGQLFMWWSRQTFHQVVGAEAYFAIDCWAVVPQKSDQKLQEHGPIH